MTKINFNDEKSLTEIKNELIKNLNELKGNKEKIKILEDSIESSNKVVGFLIPLIKQILKKKKIIFLLLIALECLLYGIISQSYSLIKFVINLF